MESFGYHRYDSKTTTGIERVYTGGTLNAPQGTYVGGIVGLMQGYSSKYNHLTYVKNSYSTMATTGKTYVGGLVGTMRYSHLHNTYSIGKVLGTRNAGGVVASANSACYANNTYWGKGITSQTNSALGIIKTVPQLGKRVTYNNYDFANIWGIDEDETTAYLKGMEIPEIIKEIIKGYNQQLGDGTKENPYQIWTVEQLQNVKNDLTAYYIVMADLDLGEINQWAPLGTKDTPFTGNFNGNGYTIENMTIKLGSTADIGENIGLFGYVNGGTIKNITLENYNISGGYGKYIGGIAGFNDAGNITKVYAEGNIILSSSTKSTEIGSMIGKMSNKGICEQCYSGGNIVCGNAEDVGGFVGAAGGVTFRNCYTSTDLSKVNAYTDLGGFVGYLASSTTEYCMALGKVCDGPNSRGGFQGGTYGGVGTVTSCYWSKELSGLLKGNCGTQKEVSSLVKQASYSGWNFSSIWSIEEGKSFAYLQGMKIPSIVFDSVAEYPFMEGKGTATEPYIITNAEQLQKVQYDLSAYYILGNDIDLGNIKKWTPIGEGGSLKKFTGNFDGKGYTIKNMQIIDTSSEVLGDNVGLFGVIDGATITNLTLENYTIQGKKNGNTGALVGKGCGNISNIYTSGNIKFETLASGSGIGGIIGWSEGVKGTTIQKCYTEGNITGKSYNVGGIVGHTDKTTISNCYSAMNLTGNRAVGGIIGHAYSSTTLNYSYAIGKITGELSTGGLVGSKGDGTNTCVATSSYWCAELTGQLTSPVGINTTISNLSRQAPYSGWNFASIWAIEEGTSFAYLQGMKIPDVVYDHLKGYSTVEGAGTSANPYIITTAQQLEKVRYDLKAYYTLGNDIDLSSITKWDPIGTEENPFTGNFNGDGHTIKNMKITTSSSIDLGSYIGLFGYVNGATITNVTLDNYNIVAGSAKEVGSLVGNIKAGSISKVYANGTITLSSSSVTSNYIGGLVGRAYTVSGASVRINQCYTEGNIIANKGGNVGGIIGQTSDNSANTVYITNCYSSMNVTGNSNVGGLVGAGTSVTSYTNIQYSYAIGQVKGNSSVGGLVGSCASNCKAIYSYWCTETTGQYTSALGSNISISALTKQASYSGWNFSSIWAIDEGGSFAYLQGMKKPEIVTEKVKGYSIIEGAGSSSNPYILKNEQQLTKVKYDLSAYYQLGNDIDLSSITKWEPIGTNDKLPFKGNFNGNGYTISNMKINISGDMGDYIGLFGYIENATISNLTLNNYSITGGYGDNIGALVGYSNGGKVSKVHTKGTISLSNTSTASKYVGGIIGYITSTTTTGSTLIQSYAEGSIHTTKGQYVGGIVGYIVGKSSYSSSTSNCYSTVNISGYSYMGGLVGSAQAYATISNSYAIGKVTAGSKTSIGGLVGAKASTASASNSYWNTTTTGQESSVLGTGYDTETMQTAATYSGWSSTIWNIADGSYPSLK